MAIVFSPPDSSSVCLRTSPAPRAGRAYTRCGWSPFFFSSSRRCLGPHTTVAAVRMCAHCVDSRRPTSRRPTHAPIPARIGGRRPGGAWRGASRPRRRPRPLPSSARKTRPRSGAHRQDDFASLLRESRTVASVLTMPSVGRDWRVPTTGGRTHGLAHVNLLLDRFQVGAGYPRTGPSWAFCPRSPWTLAA